MTALPTPEQQKAFADYRAALAKVNAHDRMKSFETIRAICDRALEWGPEYEDEARLALAYALYGVLDVDQPPTEELENKYSGHNEFGWAICQRQKTFVRAGGLVGKELYYRGNIQR